ncbi:hypothetical protein BKA62DRAFT_706921 [Auriculariales sp. MPI-PUGE-AT-0066]|nr:hypothetical protein BKA62DRAFT_706921 [Auriculariales sp. MPI-PUGE-AT-0066]
MAAAAYRDRIGFDLAYFTLRQDEARLATLDKTIGDSEHYAVAATQAFAAAAEHLQTTEDNIVDLRLQRERLAQRIATQKRAMAARPRASAKLPVELLREVFVWATRFDVGYSDTIGSLHVSASLHELKARTRIPFVLASVSRHWRTVALRSPALWSFLGVKGPSSTREVRTLRALFTTLCEWSRARPLDIFLPWDYIKADVPSTLDVSPFLSLLAGQSHRWRTFKFSMPDQAVSADILNALRGPTPLLENVELRGPTCIGASRHWRDTDVPPMEYLPSSGKLRRFCSRYNHGLFIAEVGLQPGGLVHLREMELYAQSASQSWMWRALKAAPNLETLDIFFHSEDHPTTTLRRHLETIDITRLRSLALGQAAIGFFTAAAQVVRLPVLEKLELSWSRAYIRAFMSDFMPRHASTLIELKVSGAWDSLAVCQLTDGLRSLRNLRRLRLETSELSDSLFNALALPPHGASDNWLLPQLEEFKIRSCKAPSSCAAALVDFVRMRSYLQAQNLDHCPPSRLRVVIVEGWGGFGWTKAAHRAQVRTLLGMPQPDSPDIDQEEDSIFVGAA